MMMIILVAGARPNFMKIAPLVRQLRAKIEEQGAGVSPLTPNPSPLSWKLIHTGQHYDEENSQVFFDELEIPVPDYHLNAGPGTHAEQTV